MRTFQWLPTTLLCALAATACTSPNDDEVTFLSDAGVPAGGSGGSGGSGGASGGSNGGASSGGSNGGANTGGTPTGGTPTGGTPVGGVISDAGPQAPDQGHVGPPGDVDDDGIPDAEDNCPRDANHGQGDADGDGPGDPCDNCPDVSNADQADQDADGTGDLCDLDDTDRDGVPDLTDDCPLDADPRQLDTDADGIGDACDNCPDAPNFSQLDTDADGVGDVCEIPGDDDGDGVPDATDLCPQDRDPANRDTDEDGRGDACDNCPNTPNFSQRDSDGNGLGDACDGGGPVPEPDAAVPPPRPDAGLPPLPDAAVDPGPQPGDPCAGPADCAIGDRCIVDDGTPGRVLGGFCYRTCRGAADCTGGTLCVNSPQGPYCAQGCAGNTPCREGWQCDVQPNGLALCLTDCSVVGCERGNTCNLETLRCEPTCPYACGAGETCTGGHCVRADGSCETDYHCPTGTQTCLNGRCATAEYAVCTGDPGICDATQSCIVGQSDDYCLFACATNADCDQSRTCVDGQNFCYYAFCGPLYANGVLYGACSGAGEPAWTGTCIPLDDTTRANGGPEGICLEGGTAPVGAPCNLDAHARTPADVALRCEGGSYCNGDFDEALDPANDGGDLGTCALACDPVGGVCPAQTRCVDFTSRDDASTPDRDETRPFGLCLATDCVVDAAAPDPCGPGRACRPLSIASDRGQCGNVGPAPFGAGCVSSAQCVAGAHCGDAGEGRVCLPLCDPAFPGCAPGEACTNVGGFSLCL
jgi:hypothetical protein